MAVLCNTAISLIRLHDPTAVSIARNSDTQTSKMPIHNPREPNFRRPTASISTPLVRDVAKAIRRCPA